MKMPLAVVAVVILVLIIVVTIVLVVAGRKTTTSPIIQNAAAVFDPAASYSKGISGNIVFHQARPLDPTLVKINVSGFAPGAVHGLHIHQFGDLLEGCGSACAHYNPEHQQHGSQALHGKSRHAGDLCNNITADTNGRATIQYYDDLVSLSGPRSIIGRSVVIHADPDDLGKYRGEDTTQGAESGKTGNAGKRIACSVIGISGKDFS
jgi:superoxide dismutase, Cu-Zn family